MRRFGPKPTLFVNWVWGYFYLGYTQLSFMACFVYP